jgi:hypothetical protein
MDRNSALCLFEWNDFTDDVEAFSIHMFKTKSKEFTLIILADHVIFFNSEHLTEVIETWKMLDNEKSNRV